jgi:hypothetical protein
MTIHHEDDGSVVTVTTHEGDVISVGYNLPTRDTTGIDPVYIYFNEYIDNNEGSFGLSLLEAQALRDKLTEIIGD